MNNLPQLASLLKSRDAIDYKIATIIGHPTQVQSVGEYIASVIFGIALTRKIVVHKNSDGRFVRGPLAGQTVDVQWRTKHDGILHLKTDPLPDYYLVFVGSKEATTVHSLSIDRKSTRLNSSHGYISYAVFCLKKKKEKSARCSTQQ